jgi:hypothetical protein
MLKFSPKMVKIFLVTTYNTSTFQQISPPPLLAVEILQPLVEILFVNTSTKRSSNLVPIVKIGKSGDGGYSGDILHTVAIFSEV